MELGIPNEVLWVKVLQWCKQPVGSDTYNKMEEVIGKYPEHFEWEHRYKKVPDSVIKAYRKEKYPNAYKPLSNDGKGLIEVMRESKSIPLKPVTVDMFREWCKEYDKEQERVAQERRDNIKLWNKYFKKYDLEYRE